MDVDESLVREVARAVLERVAPGEKATFGVLSDEYFARRKRRADRGGLNDWGMGDAVTLLTPVVLAATSDVLKHMLTTLAEGALARSRDLTVRAIRTLFGVGAEPASPALPDGTAELSIELTDDQWASVRNIALEAVLRHGLADDEAARVADAIVETGHRRTSGGEQ